MTAGARVHCVVLDTRTGNPDPGAPPSGVRDRAGGHGGRETPGPIPNPEVKPSSADGTARGSVWESRRPPDHTHHPRRGPGTPPRAPTPCGGTTIQQPHQHTRQRYTGTRQRTPGYDTKTHHHAVPAEGRRVLTDDEEPVFRRRAGPRRGWARVTPFRTGRVVRVRGHDPGTLRARTGMSAGHGR